MFKLEQMFEKSESIFKRIGENKKMTKVELRLPKFKIESDISLVKPLKELGIEKLFGGDARLRCISEKPIQKAFIAVDESRRPPSQKVSLRKGTR